jgi:hypothetical protein
MAAGQASKMTAKLEPFWSVADLRKTCNFCKDNSLWKAKSQHGESRNLHLKAVTSEPSEFRISHVYMFCIKHFQNANNNKIGKVKLYSLQNTDTPKMFFTPRHVGHSYTSVIRGCCSASGNACSNVILSLLHNNVLKQLATLPLLRKNRHRGFPLLRKNDPGHAFCLPPQVKRDRQTDMDGTIKCSLLMLQFEEQKAMMTVQNAAIIFAKYL